MGWPLAVSAGLMERSSRALAAALWPLTVGHLLAMLLVLFPFVLLITLVEWQRQIQIGASLLVIAFGIFRLVDRRHPRGLARIPPTQLVLWSFAVAIAHGAGLMLVPIYLGLCREADLDTGHEAASDPHQHQSRHGRAGLDRPRHRNDRSPADVWRGWSTAILVSNSYRGAGSIWIRPGPSASFWSALLRSDSASSTNAEPVPWLFAVDLQYDRLLTLDRIICLTL